MATHDIKQAAESLLLDGASFTTGELIRRSGRTRQALHRHLVRWLDEGFLVREGQGRATRYGRPDARVFEGAYPTRGTVEDSIFDELNAWIAIEQLDPSKEAERMLAYTVTEMLNNALEHSGADEVQLRAEARMRELTVTIQDRGIGAFENLRRQLAFEDRLHGLQELSKGKLTTDPEHHTGEGIFFTSKVVAQFTLCANGIEWVVDNERDDQTVRLVDPEDGTRVTLQVELDSDTAIESVFDRYTTDFTFDRTRCVVRLFEHGSQFVSRSAARRLVAGLERFREVVLDFTGIEGVGQGFVDEVFRVWANAHPETSLEPSAMNAAVEFMVRRGLPPRK